MSLRKALFWVHLTCGVVAGVVILIMSVTGALLALQPQIQRYADRHVRIVSPPSPSAARLGPDELLARVREAHPNAKPASVVIEADPNVAVAVSLGREGTLYVNPYTGEVLGLSSQHARTFFRVTTDWHRWLALSGEQRSVGRAITGACNAAFLGLAVTGIFIWWPKSWRWTRVRTALLFQPEARGKARDWNWHNVIGFWTAPVLVILTFSGMAISYTWAGNLLYYVTGNKPPVSTPVPTTAASPTTMLAAPRESQNAFRENHTPTVNAQITLNELWRRAEAKSPGWQTMTMRLPERTGAPVMFSIQGRDASLFFMRSQLALDSASGEEVRWEPYAAFNGGRKLRLWSRFAHTGEAGALPGQVVAFIACVGGAFLVYTGFALALRRFAAWRKRKQAVVVTTSETALHPRPSSVLDSLRPSIPQTEADQL